MSNGVYRWFAARIIMECIHEPDNLEDKVFEDRIVLVKARNEDEAKTKAQALPASRAQEYLNAFGEKVTWVLKEILDVVEVLDDALQEGTQVYYAFISKTQLDCMHLPLPKTSAPRNGPPP